MFGTLAGKFTDITSGRISKDEFLQSLATFTLYFVYLAIGELAGSYAMWFGFTLAGENITNRMRWVACQERSMNWSWPLTRCAGVIC